MWECKGCGGTFECYCARRAKAQTPAEPPAPAQAVPVGHGFPEKLLSELTRPSLLRLHLGEMTAQEMRTAKAAVRFTLAKCADVALPKGWLVQGEATHLYVPGPTRPNFVVINGQDPVVSVEALYDRPAVT